MPLRNARPLTVRPAGATDSIDGTNSAAGSMMALADLVPSMHTQNVWVPRPASRQMIDFSSSGALWDQARWDDALWDDSPSFQRGELLEQIGDRVYGFVTSSQFPGYSEPFCYDFSVPGFVVIQGINAGNIPKSAPETGDWTPPTLVRVGAYVLFSHPGFSLPNAFGWLDATSFNDTASGTIAANSTTITGLSKNVLLDGWRPGMIIADGPGHIASDARIVSIADDGLSIVISQPTVGGPATSDPLSVRGGTPNFPLWAAGNTNLQPLPGVATAIRLFNGRAWYEVDNAANASDAGDPLNRAGVFQPITVTIQNGLKITAAATLPFNNATVQGGIVQALLLFQGKTSIWQVTGDPTTDNLALNFLSSLGTDSPLSLASCPEGMLYIAPDGLRMIQLDGTVSEPISANGAGVAMPYINAVYPSRICAAYNEDVYRASSTYYQSVSGAVSSAIVSNEFWYHLKLKAWSGPHSFPASLICASNREATAHGFLMFALQQGARGGAITLTDGAIQLTPGGAIQLMGAQAGAPGIWFSNTRPQIDSIYVENGKALSWTYRTTLLPDTGEMFENFIVESEIAMALPATMPANSNPSSGTPALWDEALWDKNLWDAALAPFTNAPIPVSAVVTALDEAGNQLASVTLPGVSKPSPGPPPALWDVAVWDQSFWDFGAGGALFAQRRIAWPKKLVFKQASIVVTGPSSGAVALGNLYLRYQRTGYMIQDIGA